MKNEKIKNLSIAPNPDYIIWSEDLENVERDATLTVSAGCVGLYIVNGVLKSINIPGRWVVKSKEEIKSASDLKLICVNTAKTFDIFCGVGNVPFHDMDLDIDTVVGMYGNGKVRITDAWSLYTTFGHAPINADEIDAYVKTKLAEIMTTRLSEVLQKYDYEDIMSQQSAISSDLEKKFAKFLISIGLEVVNFALGGINFNEEYHEKRKEHFDNIKRRKQEKEERREREREQRREVENIISIANAANNAAPQTPVAPPAAPANDLGQPVQYCPQCGMKMLKSAVYCSGCGKKLQ